MNTQKTIDPYLGLENSKQSNLKATTIAKAEMCQEMWERYGNSIPDNQNIEFQVTGNQLFVLYTEKIIKVNLENSDADGEMIQGVETIELNGTTLSQLADKLEEAFDKIAEIEIYEEVLHRRNFTLNLI
jgi:hypothetical protein